MFDRERRQARLLERYWVRLRRDRAAAPPRALDPDTAEMVTLLDRTLGSEGPSPAFARQLQARLEAEARAARTTRPIAVPRHDQPSFGERYGWLIGAGKLAAATLTLAGCVLLATVVGDLGGTDDGDDDDSTGGVGAGAATAATGGAATGGATPTSGGAAAGAQPTATSGATGGTVSTPATGLPTTADATAETATPSSGTGGTGGEVRSYPLPGAAGASVAASANAVWVASASAGVVWRLSPDGVLLATIPVVTDPATPAGDLTLVARDDVVWVAVPGERAVKRIDPSTNAVVATVALDIAPPATGPPLLLSLDAESLWVAEPAAGKLFRVHATNHVVTATLDLALPAALVSTGDAVWVVHGPEPVLSRLDPATGAVVTTLPLSDTPGTVVVDGLVATAGNVWVGVRGTPRAGEAFVFTVVRVAAATNSVAQVIALPLDATPELSFALAAGTDAVWVAAPTRLARIDATTDAFELHDLEPVAPPSACPNRCLGLAADQHGVWLVQRDTNEVRLLRREQID